MVELRLYVAGQGPNSRLAIANLTAICNQHLSGKHQIEIVDVYEHPGLALEDGVFLTPLLAIRSASPVRTIVGNLSQTDVVIAALGIEEVAT